MDADMIYKWNVPIFSVDAQLAGRELERIAKKRGALKPGYIVEESRAKKATLHGCFEWNNKKAASAYRCRQAQDMLRNIVAVRIGDVEPTKPVRAFISFRQDHEYIPMTTVLKLPTLKLTMIQMALRDIQSFRTKYAVLDELANVMGAIDEALLELREVK